METLTQKFQRETGIELTIYNKEAFTQKYIEWLEKQFELSDDGIEPSAAAIKYACSKHPDMKDITDIRTAFDAGRQYERDTAQQKVSDSDIERMALSKYPIKNYYDSYLLMTIDSNKRSREIYKQALRDMVATGCGVASIGDIMTEAHKRYGDYKKRAGGKYALVISEAEVLAFIEGGKYATGQ